MNKKVLWISLASVATLGVGGFFAWRYFKKKKESASNEATPQIEESEETKAATGEQSQTPPPHVEIEENVVYISAKWCPACQQNETTAKKVYDKYKDKVDFIMLDADDEVTKSYGYQLKQKAIPTLVFVNEGDTLEALMGVKTEEEYDAAFEKYFPSLFEKKEKPVVQKAIEPKEETPKAELPVVAQNGTEEKVAEESTEDDA